MSRNTKILFLGINPGGNAIPPDHPSDSCENGPAFVTEKWGPRDQGGTAPLQVQVQKLFKDLSYKITLPIGQMNLINKALFAYYIPFRSRNIDSLHAPIASRKFAYDLWTKILNEIDPKIIICINNKPIFPDIASILQIRDGIKPEKITTSIGWGNITAEMFNSNSFSKHYCLIRFPHLSRFQIFGREESKTYTNSLLQKAATYWSN
jgi:hypothetical protein